MPLAKRRKTAYIGEERGDIHLLSADLQAFQIDLVQDRGGRGLQALAEQTDNLVARAREDKGLVGVFTMFRANTPQIYVDIDRTKCKSMGVALSDVFNTLQTNLGAYYVNDFNQFGRTWQVNAQAESPFRSRPEDVARLQVRNAGGDMVPLGALAAVRDVTGPRRAFQLR